MGASRRLDAAALARKLAPARSEAAARSAELADGDRRGLAISPLLTSPARALLAAGVGANGIRASLSPPCERREAAADAASVAAGAALPLLLTAETGARRLRPRRTRNTASAAAAAMARTSAPPAAPPIMAPLLLTAAPAATSGAVPFIAAAVADAEGDVDALGEPPTEALCPRAPPGDADDDDEAEEEIVGADDGEAPSESDEVAVTDGSAPSDSVDVGVVVCEAVGDGGMKLDDTVDVAVFELDTVAAGVPDELAVTALVAESVGEAVSDAVIVDDVDTVPAAVTDADAPLDPDCVPVPVDAGVGVGVGGREGVPVGAALALRDDDGESECEGEGDREGVADQPHRYGGSVYAAPATPPVAAITVRFFVPSEHAKGPTLCRPEYVP